MYKFAVNGLQCLRINISVVKRFVAWTSLRRISCDSVQKEKRETREKTSVNDSLLKLGMKNKIDK